MVGDAVHQAGSRVAEMSLGWHYSFYLCLEGVLPLEGGRVGREGRARAVVVSPLLARVLHQGG